MKNTMVGLLIVLLLLGSVALAEKPKVTRWPVETKAIDTEYVQKAQKLIDGGVEFLLSQRNKNGGWWLGQPDADKGAFEPAITGLVLKGLMQHPGYTVETPVVKKGFEVLLSYQQKDGGIYDPHQGRGNYCTSIAVTALAAANNPKFKPNIEKAVKYLRSIQIQPGSVSPEGMKITKDNPYVGGVSYGKKHARPDLNNVGWWVEAMHSAGVKSDDPAMQKALGFVSRCQNRSESNDLVWAKAGSNDGGFIYAPAKRDINVGESKAGPGPGGKGLRSYGSISYQGFKSMLYAGLGKNDPRVKSVYAWIRKHWSLDCNPNIPTKRSQQGMYFYYLVFARTLRAWGVDEISAVGGDEKYNWRKDLIDALAKRVHKNGSWFNAADRWAEGSPVLVTAYEVLALEEVLKK
ncbi:MAG: terpene cyclase/mutase family protein [Phycisphaerae bacterium]|nr:terpene cyclase/mutase family protein [Phycisphaerae bacterium]